LTGADVRLDGGSASCAWAGNDWRVYARVAAISSIELTSGIPGSVNACVFSKRKTDLKELLQAVKI
jgi:hypothetical protein